MSIDAKDTHSPPQSTSRLLNQGYNQTYIIFPPENRDVDDKSSDDPNGESAGQVHDVFFRCGNWCYRGPIHFEDITVNTAELPALIPALQRQQGNLRYYCNASSVKIHSDINEPLEFLHKACEFVAEEVTSAHVDTELRKWSSVFPWIDDDHAATYFELALEPPAYMDRVSLIASKTYNRGLIIIGIYFDGLFYFVLLPGEGEQHLLDVRFPNVSSHGQGLHIASYREETPHWRKLTLWHTLSGADVLGRELVRDLPKATTTNLASGNYIQTYCILKSELSSSGAPSVQHEALFRFGSWCYAGKVQLTPELNLGDVPFVIPALRMQQSRMTYLCDSSRMPNASYFTKPMEFVHNLSPLIEEQIYKSEETLQALIERLSRMGLGDSVTKWLEGDAGNSFFEFRIASTPELERMMKRVELIASKCYHPSGIVTITLLFQKTIYVTIAEAGDENPLLDSRFPDVSAKGRGYQLHCFPEGAPGWADLRKVTIWQTVSALEEEFKDRAAKLGEAKREADRLKEEGGALQTSNETEGGGNPSNVSVRRVLSQSSPKHSFRHRLDNYSSVFDDEFDEDRRVAESKASPVVVKRKSFEDASSRTSAGQQSAKLDAESLVKSESDEKSSSSSAAGFGSKVDSPTASSRFHVARPHHVPKLNSLASSLDKIRQSLGEEGAAPNWNSFGKPLKKLGQAKEL